MSDLLKGGGALLQRLQVLLPKLQQSNKDLDVRVASGADVDIESIGEGHVIQMDLSLGVATLPDELAPSLLSKVRARCCVAL